MVVLGSIRRGFVVAGAAVALAVGLVASAQAAVYENPSAPTSARVDDLMRRMTLQEKIGQMTQAERDTVYEDARPITKLNLGAILSGGGSVPTPNVPSAWADMIDRFQRAALKTRLHIPILYGIDSVHGDGNLYGATVFPQHRTGRHP